MKLSVVEVKGLWEGPFCKRNKNLFENLAFFSAHRCLLLCSCAFCLLLLVCVQHLCPFLLLLALLSTSVFDKHSVHHPSFHPCAEKVRSNDAESAKPFKVETGVEPLFGSVLVQSSPRCVSVYVCVCWSDLLTTQKST